MSGTSASEKEMMRQSGRSEATLLLFIVTSLSSLLTASVDGYECTSDVDCQYKGCDDVSLPECAGVCKAKCFMYGTPGPECTYRPFGWCPEPPFLRPHNPPPSPTHPSQPAAIALVEGYS